MLILTKKKEGKERVKQKTSDKRINKKEEEKEKEKKLFKVWKLLLSTFWLTVVCLCQVSFYQK